MTDAERLAKLRHDLSNPLSALLAEAQLLLLNSAALDADTLASLREIEALAIRMIGAAVVCLLVAGLIEGFISASPRGIVVRAGASAASLLFLGVYLLNGWRVRHARPGN